MYVIFQTLKFNYNKNMFVKIIKQFCKQKSVTQAVKAPEILNKAE